jgi:hypothetical protein
MFYFEKIWLKLDKVARKFFTTGLLEEEFLKDAVNADELYIYSLEQIFLISSIKSEKRNAGKTFSFLA